MTNQALAFSSTAPNDYGPMSFSGSGSKAINFITVSGNVLTLHKYGFGMGPFGWLISSDTFAFIQSMVTKTSNISLDERGITFDAWRLCKGNNSKTLSIENTEFVSLPVFNQFLLDEKRETGLYGPLFQAITDTPPNNLDFIYQQLDLWDNNLTPDWDKFIGAGPGLTPSHDDMLIGMIFCARLFPSLQEKAGELLPKSLNLLNKTTSVSAGYLEQARDGFFSEPILTLLTNNACEFYRNAKKFLNHGHFSGADTLLGMWVFFNYLFHKKPELFK